MADTTSLAGTRSTLADAGGNGGAALVVDLDSDDNERGDGAGAGALGAESSVMLRGNVSELVA